MGLHLVVPSQSPVDQGASLAVVLLIALWNTRGVVATRKSVTNIAADQEIAHLLSVGRLDNGFLAVGVENIASPEIDTLRSM